MQYEWGWLELGQALNFLVWFSFWRVYKSFKKQIYFYYIGHACAHPFSLKHKSIFNQYVFLVIWWKPIKASIFILRETKGESNPIFRTLFPRKEEKRVFSSTTLYEQAHNIQNHAPRAKFGWPSLRNLVEPRGILIFCTFSHCPSKNVKNTIML